LGVPLVASDEVLVILSPIPRPIADDDVRPTVEGIGVSVGRARAIPEIVGHHHWRVFVRVDPPEDGLAIVHPDLPPLDKAVAAPELDGVGYGVEIMQERVVLIYRVPLKFIATYDSGRGVH
jgi:hypothetical protein